jgi:predicted DNA-binding transcriptional regulator AlpA
MKEQKLRPRRSFDLEALLTVEDVAALCHTTSRGIHAMRYRGTGPRGVRIGRRVLFRPEDVERWLTARAEEEA